MPTAIFRTFLLALAACLSLSLPACRSSSKDSQKNTSAGGDLASLQGRWEQLPDEPGGPDTPRQRVIKEVNGRTETVTT